MQEVRVRASACRYPPWATPHGCHLGGVRIGYWNLRPNRGEASLYYRRDIDGLRAVAVVPVVFFHAAVPGFGGGFVGVDVFFVISGYLITSLISEEIRQGRFSIVKFYERRVRRIFPGSRSCAGR